VERREESKIHFYHLVSPPLFRYLDTNAPSPLTHSIPTYYMPSSVDAPPLEMTDNPLRSTNNDINGDTPAVTTATTFETKKSTPNPPPPSLLSYLLSCLHHTFPSLRPQLMTLSACVAASLWTILAYSAFFSQHNYMGPFFIAVAMTLFIALPQPLLYFYIWETAYPGFLDQSLDRRRRKILTAALVLAYTVTTFVRNYHFPRPPLFANSWEHKFFGTLQAVVTFVAPLLVFPYLYKDTGWFERRASNTFSISVVLWTLANMGMMIVVGFSTTSTPVSMPGREDGVAAVAVFVASVIVTVLLVTIIYQIAISHRAIERKTGKLIEKDGFYLMATVQLVGNIPFIAGTVLGWFRTMFRSDIFTMIAWQASALQTCSHFLLF
jgi:hypothetical protein